MWVQSKNIFDFRDIYRYQFFSRTDIETVSSFELQFRRIPVGAIYQPCRVEKEKSFSAKTFGAKKRWRKEWREGKLDHKKFDPKKLS